MIAPDYIIRRLCEEDLLITPYEPSNINPASIDLRLGNKFIELHSGKEFTADFLLLNPGDAVLATTMEYVRIPNTFAGLLALKSSSARRGLDHALAGWVDPGFEGELTLELHAHRQVRFEVGQRVIQLVLMTMYGEPDEPYKGRYQLQKGPTAERPEKGNQQWLIDTTSGSQSNEF